MLNCCGRKGTANCAHTVIGAPCPLADADGEQDHLALQIFSESFLLVPKYITVTHWLPQRCASFLKQTQAFLSAPG